MREWPESRFAELAQCLNEHSGIPFIVLRPSHSFCEMLSLIEHCELFVGNDSGPAILAQCFGRATFVILGATRPDLVLLSDDAIGIIKDVGCNGCKHFARHTDIICASPTCLAELSVEDVFGQVIAAWKV
jgi:ADP-heptose:LPS heptosyltransferase